MNAALRSSVCRSLCLALFALVALTVGFAHSAFLDAPRVVVSAEFELPGGIVPTLCVSKDQAAFGSHHPGELCTSCLLTGAPEAVALPPVLPVVIALESRLPRPEGRADLSEVAVPTSRGPPLGTALL